MGRSGAARRHARMAHASAPAAAHADPHPAGQNPQRATTPPQQQDSAVFSVDDASTWAAFLRCSSEPYLDFYVALKQRFAVPWTQAGTAAERASLHRSLLSLSVLVLGLVAAKSDAELESVLTACRAAYEVLVETDRAAQRRAAQNTAAPTNTVAARRVAQPAAPATAAPTPPQRQQQQQSPPSSAGFCVDDVSTWEEFLNKSPCPLGDFYSVLENHFSETLSYARTQQDVDRLHSMVALLTENAVKLLSANPPSVKDAILQRCDTLFRGLQTMVVHIRNPALQNSAFQLDVVPQEAQTAGSQAPRPSQQSWEQPSHTARPAPPQPCAAFAVDDPSTWAARLRASTNPSGDFMIALSQRFSAALACKLTPEQQRWIDSKFRYFTDQALRLVAGPSPLMKQVIIRECNNNLERLITLEAYLRQQRPRSNNCWPASLPQQSQPPQPKAQQRANKHARPSRATQQQPSASSGAVFELEDPTTWAVFFRGSSNTHEYLHAALKRRFSVLFSYARSSHDTEWLASELFYLSCRAVMLTTNESAAEYQLLISECEEHLKLLREVERDVSDMQ